VFNTPQQQQRELAVTKGTTVTPLAKLLGKKLDAAQATTIKHAAP